MVDVSEEKADWQRRQQAVYDGISAAQTALVSELGSIAATDLLIEAFTDTEFTDLTPRAATVPEPGSLALLLCGMALLAAHRFRRGAAA